MTTDRRVEHTPSSWRHSMFRPAAEGALRRRTRDWFGLLAGILLLVVTSVHHGDVTRSERAVFDLFNTLPGALAPIFRALYRLGALWAVGLVVVAALVAGRRRLARDLVVAGVLAWASARALGEIVDAHEGIAHSLRIAAGFGGSPAAYPSARIAVIVAVIGAAAPYVTRPARAFGWVVVALLAVSALYLGVAFPNDLVAGVLLGVTVASLVHLVFGSPGTRPTIPQITEALARLGVVAYEVRFASEQPTSSTLVLATDEHGPLRIRVVGRDDAHHQLLAKVWTSIVNKGTTTRFVLTREQQVEHEAYLMLIAAQGGVHVPTVVVASRAGPRAALLVQRPVSGARLADLEGDAISDTLLRRLWTDVNALGRSRVMHGGLDADHVIVHGEQPWIVAFDEASISSDLDDRAADVAELLASTAALVGDARAVRAAVDGLGAAAVARALPRLQPAALSPRTRQLSGERRRHFAEHLAHLRAAAAEVIGIDVPEPVQVRRITPTGAAMALGAFVAVGALLVDVGDPVDVVDAMRGADWTWLLLAIVVAFAANVAYAIALQGTVRTRLPLVPTTELQVAMSFSNLAIPAIGGQGMQVRFLQKLGVDLPSAVAAGGVLSGFGGLVAALGCFAVALAVEPARVDLSLIPTDGLLLLLLIAAGLLVLASALLAMLPGLRARVLPPLSRASHTMADALRSPGLVALLVGGNVVATIMSTWCLQLCVIAFGGHVSFWALLAANVGVVTIASIVPVPGGGTAVGTVGLSAVLVSFGLPKEVAVAAVLANQLVFYYLPAVPGWFATRDLVRRDYL
ncbi:MAG TPA: lysylphosphatidylglycerol synthase domain-containing protein [Acidimicrobiia bacterium]